MKQIVFASGNKGKLKEFAYALSDIKFVTQDELGIPEAIEDGLTFVENALIKARNAVKYANLPALADDSGLVIPALHGEPGIYSSRYAGVDATDEDNINKILEKMQSQTHREAYFYTSLVYVEHALDPTPILAYGRWDGYIDHELKGCDGFGYDPIFYLPEFEKSAAQLSLEEKTQLSHRGQAIRMLQSLMA